MVTTLVVALAVSPAEPTIADPVVVRATLHNPGDKPVALAPGEPWRWTVAWGLPGTPPAVHPADGVLPVTAFPASIQPQETVTVDLGLADLCHGAGLPCQSGRYAVAVSHPGGWGSEVKFELRPVVEPVADGIVHLTLGPVQRSTDGGLAFDATLENHGDRPVWAPDAAHLAISVSATWRGGMAGADGPTAADLHLGEADGQAIAPGQSVTLSLATAPMELPAHPGKVDLQVKVGPAGVYYPARADAPPVFLSTPLSATAQAKIR